MRAWNRGLDVGRYKAVDDTLAHSVEAYSGMPELFFTWARRADKHVHVEFLDNSVAQGERPRTVAFGVNDELHILDVGCLLDIERYRKVNVDAAAPELLFGDGTLLAPERNAAFLRECVERLRVVDFADQATGRIYLSFAPASRPVAIARRSHLPPRTPTRARRWPRWRRRFSTTRSPHPTAGSRCARRSAGTQGRWARGGGQPRPGVPARAERRRIRARRVERSAGLRAAVCGHRAGPPHLTSSRQLIRPGAPEDTATGPPILPSSSTAPPVSLTLESVETVVSTVPFGQLVEVVVVYVPSSL